MAELPKRIAALTGAVLFLVTTVGFSFLVIWQSHQQSKKETQISNSTNATNNIPKLEGTKLTDYQPIASVDKLQIIDQKVGEGPEAKASDTVTAHYTGATASDGTIFQSSLDSGQPVSFALNQVIKGWQDGVPGMKVGGQRRLLIPAADAYGSNPPQGSGIPPNASLVFDIVLVKIGK